MLDRLHLVSAVIVAISFGGLPPETTVAQTNPNVVVIIVDDAGYADFGFTNPTTGQTGFNTFNDFDTPDVTTEIDSLTPNIDALAHSGVIMSRAYVAPNCQPTRASVVTGGYQQRVGNENVGNNNFAVGEAFDGVPRSANTIWDLMKNQNYTTGAVGKWHLGQLPDQTIDGTFVPGNRPQFQGVDEFRGHWHGSRTFKLGNVNGNLNSKTYQTQALREAVVTSRDANGNTTGFTDAVIEGNYSSSDYITDVFGDLATDFIKDHANETEPFLLYQAFTAPHKPWESYSPAYNDPRIAHLRGDNPVANNAQGENEIVNAKEFSRRKVASMMISLDDAIGDIVSALHDPNGDGDTADSVYDNTLIVFVNDNGGVSGKDQVSGNDGVDNGPLSGYKGSMKDGGIRVPMFISGAGVTNGGTTYDSPVHGIDILPTALALAGGPNLGQSDGVDGRNLLPFINGTEAGNPHDSIVVKWGGAFSVIHEDDNGDIWKLVNTQRNPEIDYSKKENNYRLYQTKNAANSGASDVAENADLDSNAAYGDLVNELKRDLVKREAVFDKGRAAILSRSIDDDLEGTGNPEPRNIFEHFVFTPTASGTTNWSTADQWLAKNGIDNVPSSDLASPEKSLHLSDSFAGAILEFGVSDSDYTATNDMFRQTGGDFMLNKLVLSGDFANASSGTGTIDGNALVFTKDLDGVGPEIAIDATKSGAGNFDFNINNDYLVLYDDLTIAGNGQSSVTIGSVITDYYSPFSELIVDGQAVGEYKFDANSRHNSDAAFGARELTKQGTSTATLTGNNTYSGNTMIEAGTLGLALGGRVDNTPCIDVHEGAILDVSGTTGANAGGLAITDGQTLSGSGTVVGNIIATSGSTVRPGDTIDSGSSIGEFKLENNLDVLLGSTIEIELGDGMIPGTNFSSLVVGGKLLVKGADLVLKIQSGASIKQGDVFDVLDFGSLASGSFFNSVQMPDGYEFDTSQLFTTGKVSAVSVPVRKHNRAFLLAIAAVVTWGLL